MLADLCTVAQVTNCTTDHQFGDVPPAVAHLDEVCSGDVVGSTVVTWDVRTSRGDIHAEHVVNAGGFWGRDVGRMVGLELPLLAMAHQYILTEPVPEVAEYRRTTGKELPTVVDFG